MSKTIQQLEEELKLHKEMFELLCQKTLGFILVEEDLDEGAQL